MASRTCVITGCSTGVGRALALLLAKERPSYTVYATMRSPQSEKGTSLVAEANELGLSNLHVHALDVCSDASVAALMETVAKQHAQVDVLVNNAGFAINGTHEMNSMDEIKRQFDTNVFGVMRMHSAVLPGMRRNKSGHIICVSSVGGLCGTPFNDAYCSTKFCVEGLLESMAATNLVVGINTSLVEPGAILTSFIANAERPEEDAVPEELKEAYASYRSSMEALFAGNTAQTAEEVAAVVLKAIEDGESGTANLRYQTSERAAAVAGFKLKDPTGNSARDAMTQRFFTSLKPPQ